MLIYLAAANMRGKVISRRLQRDDCGPSMLIIGWAPDAALP